ncbi:MAG: hypothetical protein WCJ35_02300 [Planctomycetota bacterium]
MEITRNQYYMAGLVLLLLGIQFRMIESVELKDHFAKFIAERTDHPLISVSSQSPVLAPVESAAINRVVHPPEWIGYVFASLGSVLVLHSLAMPKSP